MDIIDEFYNNLFTDYKLYSEESIIYKWYEKEFYSSAERYFDCADIEHIDPALKLPRPSISDRILWAYNKWVKNADPKEKEGLLEYFYYILPILTKNHKTYSYVDRIKGEEEIDDIRDVFLPFFQGIIDVDKSVKKKFFQDHLEELESEKAQKQISKTINRESVEKLHHHLISRMICKSYDDYLYNAGYDAITEIVKPEEDKTEEEKKEQAKKKKKKNKQENNDQGMEDQEDEDQEDEDKKIERFIKLKPRESSDVKKKDITMELMMLYLYKYGSLPISSINTNEDYINRCKDVVKGLLKNKHNNSDEPISIPVFSDCITGCSLRIISRHYYTLELQDKEGFPDFCFAVFSPDLGEKNSDHDQTQDLDHIYTHYGDNNGPDVYSFDKIERAIDSYRQHVKEAKYGVTGLDGECIIDDRIILEEREEMRKMYEQFAKEKQERLQKNPEEKQFS